MSNDKKLVSLSESSTKNSSKTVKCPKCAGGDKSCKTCFGSGEITKSKALRLQ